MNSDRFSMVRLLRDAHAASDLPFKFSAPHALHLVDNHISSKSHLALVFGEVPAGILLASSQSHPFADVKYAFETVWWIQSDSRGKAATEMLDYYEDWAKYQGCVFAGMAALQTFQRASIIYRRRGYEATETHFLKKLVA